MLIKTYTFYKTEKGWKSDSRKLSLETLRKKQAQEAYYACMDVYAPSRGFFNQENIRGL